MIIILHAHWEGGTLVPVTVEGLPTAAALGRAVSGVYGVLEETERRQSYELALIASAERMVRPDRLFAPSAVPPGSDAEQRSAASA